MHIHIRVDSLSTQFPPISDNQQSWGYDEGTSKGPRSHALLVIADLINSLHKTPVSFNFRSMSRDHSLTTEPFQFSLAAPVVYEGSYLALIYRNTLLYRKQIRNYNANRSKPSLLIIIWLYSCSITSGFSLKKSGGDAKQDI